MLVSVKDDQHGSLERLAGRASPSTSDELLEGSFHRLSTLWTQLGPERGTLNIQVTQQRCRRESVGWFNCARELTTGSVLQLTEQ